MVSIRNSAPARSGRVLQRQILNELSKEILSGQVSKDAVVEAVLEDEHIRFVNVELPTVE